MVKLLKNNVYIDTDIYEERYEYGKNNEAEFLEYLNEKGFYGFIQSNNRFCSYDFIYEHPSYNIYLEVRTKNHEFGYYLDGTIFSLRKVEQYRKIMRKSSKQHDIFYIIFNFFNNEKSDYYYIKINFKDMFKFERKWLKYTEHILIPNDKLNPIEDLIKTNNFIIVKKHMETLTNVQ
jgi:hypothetical protein